MQASVRWIYAADTEQQRPALCVVYGDQTLCIQAGPVVRCLVKTAKEFIGLRQVSDNGEPYSINRAVTKLQETGTRIGITKSAKLILAAIAADDERMLMYKAPFTDEEGKTMLNEDENETEEGTEEVTPTPAKAKRLPPPSKKAPPARAAKPEPTTVKKETKTMPAKKTVTKKAAPAAKKSAAKKSAPAAKAAAGEGGFRAGSNMEKGFVAYKADRAKYQKFERGDKQAWAQKLADKLDTTLNSVRTMISKNWEPLLAK